MLTIVFVVTVVTAIVAHHFLIVRPREKRLSREIPLAMPIPLSATVDRLPRGVFLQPTYTWGHFDRGGELLCGVHPLVLGLIGAPYDLELKVDGGEVQKGSPLFRVGKSGRWLTLLSPVTGKIVDSKAVAKGEEWDRLSGDVDEWLCRIEPEQVEREVPTWMVAESALEWTKRKYSEIRDHLLAAGADRELAVTMADGGEIPVGVLADFDDDEWRAVQDMLLRS